MTQNEPDTQTSRPIKLNRAKCLHCNDVIISSYRHDYRTCSCGTIAVDGGTSYLRRSERIPGACVDMSEFYEA